MEDGRHQGVHAGVDSYAYSVRWLCSIRTKAPFFGSLMVFQFTVREWSHFLGLRDGDEGFERGIIQTDVPGCFILIIVCIMSTFRLMPAGYLALVTCAL